ncbi:hypothetical protein [Polyangium mundeleinium]|uniref:AdoMet activation domain-containing protein n=1 Tax=Polyangium mundeleinium TaxID=2995306 RepID=A0ABT5ELA2_9BACT|nr:hypothetical protein [Polyangium mundeleinium]MDC0742124.1 hypothetical protein [Polyangium mundeleinium]
MRLLRRGVNMVRSGIPAPDEREVLRALRVPHATRIADIDERGVREAITLALDRALGMASFEGVFRTAEVVEIREDEVVTEESPPGLLRSSVLAERFAGAREVAFLVVTLGERWDEALDELARRGEPAEAWFLDALGTFLVDRAARVVEARITSDLARAGLARSARYRPGYIGYPMEAQGALCPFVEASRIGVTVNEAMSLWPRKSVTTVVAFVAREDGRTPEDEGDPVVIGAESS